MIRKLRVASAGLLGAFTVLMAVAGIRDVIHGRLKPGPFLVIVMLCIGCAWLVRWLLRSAAIPSETVTILREDGAIHSVARGFLREPTAQVGDRVDTGDMLGVVRSQLPTGGSKAALVTAQEKLQSGDWVGALGLYQEVLAKHPDTAAMCLANIGACHFLLGAFDAAIDSYRRAQAAGANPIIMADNIREAEEAKAP
jgi:hypothetical protein